MLEAWHRPGCSGGQGTVGAGPVPDCGRGRARSCWVSASPGPWDQLPGPPAGRWKLRGGFSSPPCLFLLLLNLRLRAVSLSLPPLLPGSRPPELPLLPLSLTRQFKYSPRAGDPLKSSEHWGSSLNTEYNWGPPLQRGLITLGVIHRKRLLHCRGERHPL